MIHQENSSFCVSKKFDQTADTPTYNLCDILITTHQPNLQYSSNNAFITKGFIQKDFTNFYFFIQMRNHAPNHVTLLNKFTWRCCTRKTPDCGKKKTKTYLPSLNYALLVKLSFLHFHYQYKMRTNDKRLIMFASITWSFKWSITKFSLNCSINVHMFLLIDLNFTWMENKGFNIRVKGLQKRIALFKKISIFYKRKELHYQKSTPG